LQRKKLVKLLKVLFALPTPAEFSVVKLPKLSGREKLRKKKNEKSARL